MLGEGRWVLYGALEAWAVLRYLERSGRGRELAHDYRELAREVARRISTGERPEGSFDYYEALTHFAASGAFDHSQDQPGLQPETDPETHNGRVWELARAIYLPGGEGGPGTPAYERALEYYRTHAVGAEFAWAWGANGLEQQVYQDLIRGSDEAVRDATAMLGIILANHIVSAIDALVMARLQRARTTDPARLRGSFDPLTDRWSVGVHIPSPRR
ncbi:MAG TPA: hypothetical protein VMK65_14080 [Longimicrobiales bacterium]|nr:hypothetical protein [Longimicrobiales bacterium]